jgi:Mn2+/Fe2+ NRAMP family transporter
MSSGVQLGNSPEGNAEHIFETYDTLHLNYACILFSIFNFAQRKSSATATSTLAYHGFILLYATTT